MPENAWTGLASQTPADDEAAGGPPRRPFGVIVAAVVALAASAGLAWWIAAPNPAADVSAVRPPTAPAAQRPAAPPLRYASAEPDPNQVRRALGEVTRTYAVGGADALVEASTACAKALAIDPRRLDYCLAYDVYASAIVPPGSGPQADWFAEGGDRDLALARTALPRSVDAANRIAQVGALTQAVLPKLVLQRPAAVRTRQVRKAVPVPPKMVKAQAIRQAIRPKARKPKLPRTWARRPWYPPAPSTLDAQLAREAAAEAQLDRMIAQGLIDPPH
jgi:hypothetical protein